MKLPLFPLNLVCFPDENVNLHIFEPRYKQLINESWENNTTFGIPAFIDGKLMPIGTEIRVKEIVNISEKGEMDIKTKALRTFDVLEFHQTLPDKLYAGGTISFREDLDNSDEELHTKIQERLQNLYVQLGVAKELKYKRTFDVAHYVGFTVQEEYRLLQTDNEKDRQVLLLNHLDRIIPAIVRAKKIRERMQMNGHFKNLDKLDI